MERIHMNQMRDLIQRLKKGESERRIAADMQVSRPTIHKYHEIAKQAGYLETGQRSRMMRPCRKYWDQGRNRQRSYPVWSPTEK